MAGEDLLMDGARTLMDINLFGLGTELLAITAIILFAGSIATTKEDWGTALMFGYVLMFFLGIATEMWMFVVTVLMVGLYHISSKAENKV